MIDSAERLQKNWKKLSCQWDDSCRSWKDEQQLIFGKKFWQPLTYESNDIIRSSQTLVELIESARRSVK